MSQEITFPVGYELLDNFVSETVAKKFPEFKVYRKRSSALMWTIFVVSFMWIWNRRFMDSLHTTIGLKIYMAEKVFKSKDWYSFYASLRHEFIHMLQDNCLGWKYKVGYLFPQCLSVLALVALLALWMSNWFLLALIFLAALLPLPAPFRTRYELEGYTQSLLVEFERTGHISLGIIGFVAKQFYSMNYYFMWPFPNSIKSKIIDIADRINSGEIKGEFFPY